MTLTTVEDAAELLRMEFLEMPGLRLTGGQVQRLCSLPGEVSDQALTALVESGFLKRNAEGFYLRQSSSPTIADVTRIVPEIA
jgi:hypothetical protein